MFSFFFLGYYLFISQVKIVFINNISYCNFSLEGELFHILRRKDIFQGSWRDCHESAELKVIKKNSRPDGTIIRLKFSTQTFHTWHVPSPCHLHYMRTWRPQLPRSKVNCWPWLKFYCADKVSFFSTALTFHTWHIPLPCTFTHFMRTSPPSIGHWNFVVPRRRRRHERGRNDGRMYVRPSVRVCVRACVHPSVPLCERDNSFNSSPILTKLNIWTSFDIVSVKLDNQTFPCILIRWAGIWLVDFVNAITPSILHRFWRNLIFGLFFTLSRSSLITSYFCAY
jgi:hypothetical protein